MREWSDKNASDAYCHRHLSQIYALMPGYEVRENEKLKKGIEKSIEKCIENGFLREMNGTCGWSVMHLINAYARLEDKAGLEKALTFLFERFIRENMTFCLTDNKEHYQIDANPGYVNALYEMTIFSDENSVVLLPCMPDFIESPKCENLLLKGGMTIKELRFDKKGIFVEIYSKCDKNLSIKYKNSQQTVKLRKNTVEKISVLCQ